MTFSPEPQIFFKPLYSSSTASTNKYPTLGKVFSVASDRSISYEFMKELNRLVTYQSGVVILDDLGFKSFTSWFSPRVTNLVPRLLVPQTSSNPEEGETGVYKQICSSLENTIHPSFANLPWKELFPNHLLAYPTLQGLTRVWERLILSDQSAHCEVIPSQ
jgi:hypothetical protein